MPPTDPPTVGDPQQQSQQDPSADQDLLKASPTEQHAYLNATDPDYAHAPKHEQAAYLQQFKTGPNVDLAPPAGGPTSQPMAPGPEGLEADPNNPHPAAGLPGMNTRPVTNKDLIPGAVLGGAAAVGMGGALAAPFVRPALRYAGPLVASEGIRMARKIPYVGRMIPPGSELLPFLFGHGSKGGAAAEEAAPSGAAAAEEQNVMRVPEPREPFMGEKPGYMGSVPRKELSPMAIARKPGAAAQMQQLGQPIIYIPNDAGYPAPRSITPLDEMSPTARRAMALTSRQ